MIDMNLLVPSAVPLALCIFAVLGAIVCVIQKDLLRMAVISSVTGFAIAALYQVLLAPDVALTQAVVGAAIVPALVGLSVLKTREPVEVEDDGQGDA